MDRFLIFIIGFAIGVLLIVYRFKIVQFTGKIDFAEKYLGSGGTYNLMILVGLVAWIFSLMYALGTWQNLFGFLNAFV